VKKVLKNYKQVYIMYGWSPFILLCSDTFCNHSTLQKDTLM